jgi:hypothetical protein
VRIRNNIRTLTFQFRFSLLVVVAMCLLTAPLGAHDVVVDQIVDVDVQVQSRELAVRVRIPASALGDAKIPHRPDGTLDEAAAAEALRVVAADITRNFDLRQGDVPLTPTATEVRVGDDRRSLEVALTYPIDGDARGLSARLNTFRGTPLNPVRTNVRFQPLAGHARQMSTTGAAARVPFDPSALDVAQQFFARGLRALLGGGDHLLLLVCLLAPMRRAKPSTSLVGWMLLGQLILAFRFIDPTMYPVASSVLAMIAASIVVVVALQDIVGAGTRSIGPIVLLFGAVSGWAFGDLVMPAQQFAGAHVALAAVVFLVAILGGEIWIAAVLWATRSWLDGIGVSNATIIILTSVVVSHSALHRLAERADILAQTGTWAGDHATVLLVLAWSCVMLFVAARAAFQYRENDTRPALLHSVAG